MLKNKNLTADDAREITNLKSKKLSLEEILTQIEEEAEKGENRLVVQELPTDVMLELNRRGFYVGRIMYSTNFEVTWR